MSRRIAEIKALWWLVKFWAAVGLGLVLAVVVLLHPGAGSTPAPAPCPPSECTFHPHAPPRADAMMTPEQRRAARLESHRRYNTSAKGAARYKRYEEKHPNRAKQWSPLMDIKARRGNP